MGCEICTTVESDLSLEKKFDNKGLYRFVNKSGECYINSFLQIFLHNKSIIDIISKIDEKDINKEQNEGKLISAINQLFDEIKNNVAILTPIKIKEAMICLNENYNNNNGDINDFICDFINELIAELPRKEELTINLPNNEMASKALTKLINRFYKRNKSIFLELFCGNSLIEYYCKNNHLIDIKFNTFITIDLSLYSFKDKKSVKIEEILDDKFSSIKEQQYTKMCKTCGQETNFGEKNYIYNLPKILLLYIIRNIDNFFYDNKIEFKKEINMEKYIKYNNIINPHYKLFGIIQNINGHFNSATINNKDNNWYFFNDDHEPSIVNKDLDKFNPVLLCYSLIN
jgi:hypothetical protein